MILHFCHVEKIKFLILGITGMRLSSNIQTSIILSLKNILWTFLASK